MILSRLLEMGVTLWLVVTVIFFSLHVLPGGPFDDDLALIPEVRASLHRQYGLDQGVLTQYFIYLSRTVHFDFGESLQFTQTPVSQLLGERLPVTIKLGLISLSFALSLGIFLGLFAGANAKADRVLFPLFAAGISLPSILIGPCLVFLFSQYLHWLPPALLENPASWILPVFCLALKPTCQIARMLRNEVIENAKLEFIKAARAKGLSFARVVFSHLFTLSVLPLLGFLGPLMAHLLSGSVVTELLFAIPGVGSLLVQSILQRDYPLIIGSVLVYVAWLLPLQLLSDLLLRYFDPRVQDS